MEHPTNEQIESVLIGILSDVFNRSLNALAEAGAIDITKLPQHYTGVGSRYYDLVTAHLEFTAKHGTLDIRLLFSVDEQQDVT